ncbi:hypothetical protein EZS27_000679 [termite gut metagenome]|uniref:Uncharacterized protein n=1 Tax=termite gut metagenome TaxID=433724 RepID=A0A5J4T169_9ZZZZ
MIVSQDVFFIVSFCRFKQDFFEKKGSERCFLGRMPLVNGKGYTFIFIYLVYFRFVKFCG